MPPRALRAVPALALTAGIFWASSQPGIHVGGFAFSDKLLHFAAWALLTASYVFAFEPLGRATTRIVVIAVAMAVFYGAVDEFHQSMVVGRDASVLDWVADSCGAVACALFLQRRRR